MDAKPEVVQHYERKIALGRIGHPEDCAGVCVFLCSEAARYIVGQTLIVDGGLTLGQIGRMEG
jgi:NAD(P)-dependent dehydrogenase (short-subunit alcohol dehydrogenase family)